MTTLLRAGRLLDETGLRSGRGPSPASAPAPAPTAVGSGAWVLLDGDAIAATGAGEAPAADEVVDLGDATLVPGFVDLHVHGGGGHAMDDGGDDLEAALAAHRAHGTTRSMVSLVANPLVQLRESLAGIAALAARDPRVLGAHLEGPFLSPARRGAHEEAFLRNPDPETVEGLLEAADGALRQVTIAPELPGALDAIARLADAGVVPAVGHTEADEGTARAAFDAGARMLTHAFNAMPGIHHRAPGPIVAAIGDERVTIELILDGLHVHPDVARLLWNEAPGRVALITDAMAAAAKDDGDYRLGTLNVTVRGGLALLSGTDTIAGSTLTQDAALRKAIGMGAEPAAAVAALTAIPARAIGAGERIGRLAPGYVADVVALDPAWEVVRVWAAGASVD
jgi:N-acetylglucosamine-6-phosphate deacetylase